MKIKVLHILNRLIIGGPSVIAIDIIENLPSKYESKLIVGEKEEGEEYGDFLIKDNHAIIVDIPHMRRSLNPLQDLKAYLAIKKVIKNFKPDIVHTHASKAGAIGRMAAVSCKTPIIIHTFHGHVFHSYFNKTITKLFILVERFLAKKSTKIISISQSQKEDLVNKYKICKNDKVALIPNGINLEKFNDDQINKRQAWRKRYHFSDDMILVGIVGRMAPVKNHTMFINVASAFHNNSNFKNVKFVIIGDGGTRPEIQSQLESLGVTYAYLPDNTDASDATVVFTSWETEIDKAYAGLDIVCLTSLNEGSPITLIEAQAAKKPIISTNVGGVSDTVKENHSAYLVDSNDVKSFVSQLEYLINHADVRQAMGENGFNFVKENFNQAKLLKGYDQLYTDLLLASPQ